MAWDLAQLELEAPHFVHATTARTRVVNDRSGHGGGYDELSSAEEEDDEEEEDALLHGGMAEQASKKRTAHTATKKPKTPKTHVSNRSSSPDLVAPAAKACRLLEVKALALLSRLLSVKVLAPWRNANLIGLLDHLPNLPEPGSNVCVRKWCHLISNTLETEFCF
jgi:hypothetical protein